MITPHSHSLDTKVRSTLHIPTETNHNTKSKQQPNQRQRLWSLCLLAGYVMLMLQDTLLSIGQHSSAAKELHSLTQKQDASPLPPTARANVHNAEGGRHTICERRHNQTPDQTAHMHRLLTHTRDFSKITGLPADTPGKTAIETCQVSSSGSVCLIAQPPSSFLSSWQCCCFCAAMLQQAGTTQRPSSPAVLVLHSILSSPLALSIGNNATRSPN